MLSFYSSGRDGPIEPYLALIVMSFSLARQGTGAPRIAATAYGVAAFGVITARQLDVGTDLPAVISAWLPPVIAWLVIGREGGCRSSRAGGSLFAPAVTRRLVKRFAGSRPAPQPRLEELTSRELEVLRLVARGLSNAEIAAQLVVSEHTVKTHVAHLLRKLDLRDRVQAVVLAYEARIARPGDDTPLRSDR